MHRHLLHTKTVGELQEQALTELSDGGFADKRTNLEAWCDAVKAARQLKAQLGAAYGFLSDTQKRAVRSCADVASAIPSLAGAPAEDDKVWSNADHLEVIGRAVAAESRLAEAEKVHAAAIRSLMETGAGTPAACPRCADLDLATIQADAHGMGQENAVDQAIQFLRGISQNTAANAIAEYFKFGVTEPEHAAPTTGAGTRRPVHVVAAELMVSLYDHLDCTCVAEANEAGLIIEKAIEADRTASGLVSVEDVARWLDLVGKKRAALGDAIGEVLAAALERCASCLRDGSWLTDLARLDREGL